MCFTKQITLFINLNNIHFPCRPWESSCTVWVLRLMPHCAQFLLVLWSILSSLRVHPFQHSGIWWDGCYTSFWFAESKADGHQWGQGRGKDQTMTDLQLSNIHLMVRGSGGFMFSIRWTSPLDGATGKSSRHCIPLCWSCSWAPWLSSLGQGWMIQTTLKKTSVALHIRDNKAGKINPPTFHPLVPVHRRALTFITALATKSSRKRETNWPSTSSAQHSQSPSQTSCFLTRELRCSS